MDPNAVAKAFVEHYYSTFDANRAWLSNLYQEGSMLTFEGQKTMVSNNSGQAHEPPLPAVPAPNHHRRLSALWPSWWHARLRLWQPQARGRTARPQIQSDVPFDANSTRKLLRVE
ncbi:unnamed protein product [Fraxinus pennsylvanica]|uniref:NTF2 domain-containing protein n=1 Tax=Fraxinus pennsylvanica TaxID=56036 RepID=A0AAD1YWQ7_9LAMI|nr:unnamed protein product [Fraxinus pennsylvanica]